MTVEEMRKRKNELGYSYERISVLSGVPLGTVQKVLGGITKAPRYETLQALTRAFNGETFSDVPADGACVSYHDRGSNSQEISGSFVKEPLSGYPRKTPSSQIPPKKRQGEYTTEDYYALSDERRVELINGVFYEMPVPDSVHQSISMYISTAFFRFIRENHGSWRVFAAPLDVQLNRDDKTMVQPDILVVCDKETDTKKHIFGAPDLVIEILSEATRGRDLILKLNKYCEAGVHEYWTVDPKNKEITVFTFHEEIESVTYGCGTSVPVGIWKGKCSIDPADLFEYAGI